MSVGFFSGRPVVHFLIMAREARDDQEIVARLFSSSVAFAACVNFVSVLGILIQVKSQTNAGVSLFESHKATICCFVVVITVYFVAHVTGERFENTIGPIRLLSGTLAPILLLLILVPIFGWLMVGLWAFLAAKVAWDCLMQLRHYLTTPPSAEGSPAPPPF